MLTQSRPNIIIMLTDDQGYGDLNLHDNPIIETPRLNTLATQSLRFDNFHAAPLCAPTRASLLTGRDAMRTGVWHVHGGRDFMNLDEITLPQVLQSYGYDTAMFGKWHSGKTNAYLPYNRGFAESWMASLYVHKDNLMDHNGEMVEVKGWTTERIADMSIDYIRSHKENPFFLFVPFLAPHEPWHAPEELIQKYRNKNLSEGLARVWAMVEHVDTNVGRIIDTVDSEGMADNTIIIFMSDNGPIGDVPPNSEVEGEISLTREEMLLRNPQRFRGVKGQVYENATHVPFFLRWSNHIEPGLTTTFCHVTDIFPTLLDFAGIDDYISPLPIDGQSIRPIVNDPTITLPNRIVVQSKHDANWLGKPYEWAVPPTPSDITLEVQNEHYCIRDRQFKLVAKSYGTYDLYDLVNDPKETTDIKDTHPIVAQSLYKHLKNWFTQIVDGGRCFNIPEFIIGYNKETSSFLPMYAPTHIGGNVISGSHVSLNWLATDDLQTSRIRVRQAGLYHITLRCTCNKPGASVIIQAGARRLHATLTENTEHPIGEMILPEGSHDFSLILNHVPEGVGDAITFTYPNDGFILKRVK